MRKVRAIKQVPGLEVRVSGWRTFKDAYEVPKRVLKSQFDYLDPDEASSTFFKHGDTWHHLSNFMRVHSELADAGWDGIENWSFSNGLLIQVSPDGERYRTGYYFMREKGKTRTRKSTAARESVKHRRAALASSKRAMAALKNPRKRRK